MINSVLIINSMKLDENNKNYFINVHHMEHIATRYSYVSMCKTPDIRSLYEVFGTISSGLHRLRG